MYLNIKPINNAQLYEIRIFQKGENHIIVFFVVTSCNLVGGHQLSEENTVPSQGV
jgi:hypothetical protein